MTEGAGFHLPSFLRQLALASTSVVFAASVAQGVQPVVHLEVSSARSLPGGTVTVDISIGSEGFPTVATVNELHYPSELSIDPASCRLRAGLRKELIATRVPDSLAVRVFVAAGTNLERIPDGVLYQCDVVVAAGALPRDYSLTNGQAEAFGPNGEHVRSPLLAAGHGRVEVTLVLPEPDCDGDCDDDGTVSITDLVAAVRIVLGESTLDGCRAADADGDGQVSIADLVRAVRAALDSCSDIPRPVLHIVGMNGDGIAQEDFVRATSVDVDLCPSICAIGGNPIHVAFEPYTETRANAVLVNLGAAPIELDRYVVSIPGSGLPDRTVETSVVLPGGTCGGSPDACGSDLDCSLAQTCVYSETSVQILLYSFVVKEALRGDKRCPALDPEHGIVIPGTLVPVTHSTKITFSGSAPNGVRIAVTYGIDAGFFDANNCRR